MHIFRISVALMLACWTRNKTKAARVVKLFKVRGVLTDWR